MGLLFLIQETLKGLAIFASLTLVWVCLNVWFGG